MQKHTPTVKTKGHELRPVIMIDARIANKRQSHGIVRHTQELVSNLAKINSPFNFVVLVDNKKVFSSSKLPSNFTLHLMRTNWQGILSQLEILWVILKYRPKLFHSPSFMVPLFAPFVTLIATIHDLKHLVISKESSFWRMLYYKYFLKYKLRYFCHKIITVSKFSKQEIHKKLHIPLKRIAVIYNGLEHEFFKRHLSSLKDEHIKTVLKKYHISNDYFFCLGNKKPHKNIIKLVRAYCLGDFDETLVLLTDYDEGIFAVAEKYNKSSKIQLLSYVSDAELPILYNQCKLFIFTSEYEGFGFPPLEAMACGALPIVQKKSALPEILKDVPSYIENNIPKGILETLKKTLTLSTEDIAQRKKLGYELSSQYSWEKFAKDTHELYKSSLES